MTDSATIVIHQWIEKAYIAGQGLYWFVRDATKLPVGMDLTRAITVGGMILVMCMLSSLLAMRRLVDADPAEIF